MGRRKQRGGGKALTMKKLSVTTAGKKTRTTAARASGQSKESVTSDSTQPSGDGVSKTAQKKMRDEMVNALDNMMLAMSGTKETMSSDQAKLATARIQMAQPLKKQKKKKRAQQRKKTRKLKNIMKAEMREDQIKSRLQKRAKASQARKESQQEY